MATDSTYLPDIDFTQIRAHDGDQRKGFEELCVQLFGTELELDGVVPHRVEGSGGDGGVEAFAETSKTSEVGVQAKYLVTLTNK